jgi:tetratricopeptide (TPR) repeat protein
MRRCSSILAGSFVAIAWGTMLLGLAPSAALAQRSAILNDPGSLRDFSTSYQTAPGTGVLVINVASDKSSRHLDRQALLKLVNLENQTATWQTTEDTSQGVFTNIPYGSYDVEVSAVGYLSAHRQLQVANSLRPMLVDVVLDRDASAINLDVADRVMSAKTRKETKRAVSALKSGNLKEAEKQLDEAYKSDASSAELNFLLGYLYFQKKDYARAGDYLSAASNINPNNGQALMLLGRAGLERQDFPAARSALERAVAIDGENWQPHDLLADAYLHQKNYERARDEAKIAIAKVPAAIKSDAASAQLVLGEALVNLGQEKEGLQALDTFLRDSPRHPMAGQVWSLIAEIEEHDSASMSATAANSPPKLVGVDPLLAFSAPALSLKSWQPPGIDEIKLNLAPGMACPVEKVIEESGKRVQEMVDDVARFAAVEDLFHQRLDPYGLPIRTETRKFNYVVSISEQQPGYLSVDEFRADKLGLAGYPDQIASAGFAALALVFHPHMRDNFAMKCEGLGDWHGQASWLVRFQQRDDRPSRIHSYKVGPRIYPVKLKGRAWITADKFQIVRIESELVSSMPEIQLLSEHQVVEYGPIPFAKKNTSLWLPKSAEIYFDFRHKRYYRRHSFDHYMLFAVDSEEKRKEPQVTPTNKAAPETEKKPS